MQAVEGFPAPPGHRLHRPLPDPLVDEDTPIEETLSALDDLVHQGKVRYIGCSNYPAWRLMQVLVGFRPPGPGPL